jgi:tetratricopeptide (TPR) repeat protein
LSFLGCRPVWRVRAGWWSIITNWHMNRKTHHRKISTLRPSQPIVCLFLAITILLVYGQVRHFDFVNFDDGWYVTENRYVRSGVTKESLEWSFSFENKDKSYWHPLSWLSHMLDVELFGMDPGRHHLVNVFFHILNTLFLFIVLKRMTGDFWRSALVATLFAVHPINVESVAWVAERKTVLSTFFGVLTLLSYVFYTEKSSLTRYLVVIFFFILGLLAKPMLVTLPFVLLLLDFWPLGRIGLQHAGPERRNHAVGLLLEKIPLLLLSGLCIYLASASVQGAGNVITLDAVPLKLRVANALLSYVGYIKKIIWPQNLAVYYPYPATLPLWQILSATVFLVGVSIFAIRLIKKHPSWTVGWLWYLGTLVPVAGLMQVGLWPAMADRWAYVPLIGLLLMIVWGLPDFQNFKGQRKNGMVFGLVAFCLLFSITTYIQVGKWANSITLFKHAVHVTDDNAVAHNNLANALADKGRFNDAAKHISAALRIKPNDAGAYNNLGNILMNQGNYEEAIPYFYKAFQINPRYADAHYNLAIALKAQGKINDGLNQYRVALRLDPDNVKVLNNLANTLIEKGRVREALRHYQVALNIDPNDPEILNNYGVALIHSGNNREAVKYFKKASSLDPEYIIAKNNLFQALAKQTKEKRSEPIRERPR